MLHITILPMHQESVTVVVRHMINVKNGSSWKVCRFFFGTFKILVQYLMEVVELGLGSNTIAMEDLQ